MSYYSSLWFSGYAAKLLAWLACPRRIFRWIFPEGWNFAFFPESQHFLAGAVLAGYVFGVLWANRRLPHQQAGQRQLAEEEEVPVPEDEVLEEYQEECESERES